MIYVVLCIMLLPIDNLTDAELSAADEAEYDAQYQRDCDETDGVYRAPRRIKTEDDFDDNDQKRRDFEAECKW